MMNRKNENIDNKTEVYIPNIIEYQSISNYLIEIIKNKNEQQLIEMLSFFNKNIKAVNVLKNDIYLNIEGINELVLLNLMGSGLKKYLSIILPIIVNKFSTILADEMENGLDKESIINLLKNILKLSRNNDAQIFFTIENLELLKLLSEIVNEEFNDIKETVNIINIVNTGNDGFKSYNYNTDNLHELTESI